MGILLDLRDNRELVRSTNNQQPTKELCDSYGIVVVFILLAYHASSPWFLQ